MTGPLRPGSYSHCACALAMPTRRLAWRLPSTCGNVFRGGKTRLKMHLNDIAHGPAGANPRGPPLSCQNRMPDDAKTRGSGCRKDQINTTTWKETGNPSRTTPDSQKHPVRKNPVNRPLQVGLFLDTTTASDNRHLVGQAERGHVPSLARPRSKKSALFRHLRKTGALRSAWISPGPGTGVRQTRFLSANIAGGLAKGEQYGP